jgi:hypothetical protein
MTTMPPSVVALLREPLFHFVALGAALFALYAALDRDQADVPGAIVVSRGQIEHLAVGFSRVWQRSPTSEELDALIRDHIREEVYYREALAMGLDRDDTVIRRRLRQKLEFVSEDVAALAEPEESDLQSFLQSRPERFRTETKFTFAHVYLNPQRHGDRLAVDAHALLDRLKDAGARADISALGDRFLLASTYESVTVGEIARQFGEQFARALGDLIPGKWGGPLESGYGLHLVLVSERTQGRLPALEEVRDDVRREWMDAQRKAANEALFQKLLSRYTVTIERPQVGDPSLATPGVAQR